MLVVKCRSHGKTHETVTVCVVGLRLSRKKVKKRYKEEISTLEKVFDWNRKSETEYRGIIIQGFVVEFQRKKLIQDD